MALRTASAILLALATTTQCAQESDKDISQAHEAAVADGVPAFQLGLEVTTPAPSKVEKLRTLTLQQLEEAERALKLAGKQPDQVLAGLRQTVRQKLKDGEAIGWSATGARTVARVRALLLKSISDSARGSIVAAIETQRIKPLQVAIGSALGKTLELEALTQQLSGTEFEKAALGRFNFTDEVMPAQKVLDKENLKEDAKWKMATAYLKLPGPWKAKSLKDALDTAQSVGVDPKDFNYTKVALESMSSQGEAMQGIAKNFLRADYRKLQSAVDAGEKAKVNPLVLGLSKSRLNFMRENLHRKELNRQSAQLKKIQQEEYVELREKQKQEDQIALEAKTLERKQRQELQRQMQEKKEKVRRGNLELKRRDRLMRKDATRGAATELKRQERLRKPGVTGAAPAKAAGK